MVAVETLKWVYDTDPGLKAIHLLTADGPEECRHLFCQSFLDHTFDSNATIPGYTKYFEAQDMRPAYARHRDVLKLVDPMPHANIDEFNTASLKRSTHVSGMSNPSFELCTRVQPNADIRYVTIYAARVADDGTSSLPKTPMAVLSPQSNWQYCHTLRNQPARFKVVLQGIDAAFRAVAQITADVKVGD